MLTKTKAQMHFSGDGAKLLHHTVVTVQILVTSTLTEEYRLHQKPMEPAGQASKDSLSMGRDRSLGTSISRGPCLCRDQARGRSFKSLPISPTPQSNNLLTAPSNRKMCLKGTENLLHADPWKPWIQGLCKEGPDLQTTDNVPGICT